MSKIKVKLSQIIRQVQIHEKTVQIIPLNVQIPVRNVQNEGKVVQNNLLGLNQ